jgi:TRAP-type C4-dicarboxylate transport system permease small subunit
MDIQSDNRSTWARAGDLAIEVPAVVITFLMMVQITANAVLRTYFKQPIEYTLEMTQYWYMPTLAFLGFMAAQRRGQHIAADLIFTRLPEATKKPVLSLLYVAGAVLMVGFCYYGWGEALEAYDFRKHAGVSPLPAWPVYFLAPLAFAVMTVQFAYAAWHTMRHGVEDSIEEAELRAADVPDDILATREER